MKDPILYTFRRCPYAMRARLSITYAKINIELREVKLNNKPQQLINISPKGTVPVLQLSKEVVIDESLDIMYWALSKSDPDNWLYQDNMTEIKQLIQWNDGLFKKSLDRYKYANRYPENTELFYREEAEIFILMLEQRLIKTHYLCGESCSLADMAIFPFIRQFAYVDLDWFTSSKYQKLNQWLNQHLKSPLFISIMEKYVPWQP